MASDPNFDLIRTAEALLDDAKKLAASPSDPQDGEPALRRSIAQAARKIAFETAAPIDLVKCEWVVVCTSNPLRPPCHPLV